MVLVLKNEMINYVVRVVLLLVITCCLSHFFFLFYYYYLLQFKVKKGLVVQDGTAPRKHLAVLLLTPYIYKRCKNNVYGAKFVSPQRRPL